MKSVVIDEAAEGTTITAMLAMEDRRAKLLGIYKIIDDVEDPETCPGRMLGIRHRGAFAR